MISPLRVAGIPLRCVTSQGAPEAIETDQHVVDAVPPMLRLAKAMADEALGFVVACYSDPGVSELRSHLNLPTVGIRQASVSAATSVAETFGVIAILPASVQRQRIAFENMGVTRQWAGSRPLNLGVAELADDAVATERVLEVANDLKTRDGAQSIILGCAGMGRFKPLVEAQTGLPVIEPTQAAVALALGHILTRGT